MINAIGNAAMMDTVCRFAIELSLKMRTIGSRIRLRDQKVLIAMCGSSSLGQVLVGVGGGNQYDRVKAGGIEGDHRPPRAERGPSGRAEACG